MNHKGLGFFKPIFSFSLPKTPSARDPLRARPPFAGPRTTPLRWTPSAGPPQPDHPGGGGRGQSESDRVKGEEGFKGERFKGERGGGGEEGG